MIERRATFYLPQQDAGAKTGHFELAGLQSASLSQAQGRLVLVRVCFTLAYLVLAIRAFDLMVFQGFLMSYRDQSGANPAPVSAFVTEPRRDIVDRNGELLATSIRTVSLYADPHLMIDLDETARGLARIFPDQSYGDLVQKLQGKKRFVWVKRNLTPKEQAAVLELGQPGLAFQDEYRRLYPQGALTAHMVGYSGVDSQGLSGIEQAFDPVLKKEGDPLALTLDIRLQHVLRREIQKTMSDFTAQAGAGLIMDIKTGDILAAVSLPDFDPHQPGEAKDDPKFNRVTLGTYELGSVFKIFTTAALIENLKTPMSQTYDTREPLRVGRFTISDYHPENRLQSVPDVFMHSSNIGTAMMAREIGTEGLKNFFADLGLLKPMSFDLPELGKPQVPKPWSDLSTLTASYGHGIAITPLHLASATATIIGDGTVVYPHLVMMDHAKSKTGVRVISPETVTRMRQLMRLVVSNGTASKANVPGLMVGGKTGTADKIINGRYVRNERISTLVGAFPMNDPRYLVIAMIDNPKPNKSSYGYATAGWTAAPAVSRIISNMANLYGITPDDHAPDLSLALLPYITDPKAKAAMETLRDTEDGVMPIASVISVSE